MLMDFDLFPIYYAEIDHALQQNNELRLMDSVLFSFCTVMT